MEIQMGGIAPLLLGGIDTMHCPTPMVTNRPGDVSRLEPTSSIVLMSQVLAGRSSAAIPDVEVQQEIEFRQEPEVDNPAEIQISVSDGCEWGLGDTIPITAEKPPEIAETVSTYVSGGQENNPKPILNTSISPNRIFHIFPDIQNNYFRYLKNYFGYQNTRTYFRSKIVFWISTITISDVKKKHLFRISQTVILDNSK